MASWVTPFQTLAQRSSTKKGCTISTSQVSPWNLPDIPRLGEIAFLGSQQLMQPFPHLFWACFPREATRG